MPDVQANRRQWDDEYEWSASGDEWSAGWGGPEAQWQWTLLPRLRRFLPAVTILEIAPGYGRWTKYLVDWCDRYVGVDLSAQAVSVCRRRFAEVDHAEFHVNDGRSLAALGDLSADLAFSFDSLVHAEEDVVGAYLHELSRVLTPNGIAFIHHSNLAACKEVPRPLRVVLNLAERALRRDTGGFDQWRGTTMSASRLQELSTEVGLACIGQEVVNWLGGRPIDCVSLVTRSGSTWDRPNVVVHNPYFMAEAASSARAAQVYTDAAAPFGVSADGASAQRLGALCSIASRSVGPWGISLVGPWPRMPRNGGHAKGPLNGRRPR